MSMEQRVKAGYGSSTYFVSVKENKTHVWKKPVK